LIVLEEPKDKAMTFEEVKGDVKERRNTEGPKFEGKNLNIPPQLKAKTVKTEKSALSNRM